MPKYPRAVAYKALRIMVYRAVQYKHQLLPVGYYGLGDRDLFTVKEFSVFGSYIRGCEMVGDLDTYILLEDAVRYDRLTKDVDKQWRSGRRVSEDDSLFPCQILTQDVFRLFVRGYSKIVSIHSRDEAIFERKGVEKVPIILNGKLVADGLVRCGFPAEEIERLQALDLEYAEDD
jgi:hypothetical protein